MGDVRGGAGAVTGTVLVDTNVFTARLRERSPLATRYAKTSSVSGSPSLRRPWPRRGTER